LHSENYQNDYKLHAVALSYVVVMPRLPLIEDLTTGPLPPGSQVLVEYDPASQWYNASLTITAGWLRSGGSATYVSFVQPLVDVRSQLRRLGVETNRLEEEENLEFIDYYTATLGQKYKEPSPESSLKVADISISISKWMQEPPAPGHIFIADDESTFGRFNDEKAWIELELTRLIPSGRMRKITAITGVMIGVHSDWAYKRFEGASEGIVDFKLEEQEGRTRNIMRIRNMRNVGFDSKWHPLKMDDNFEITLEK
jgi:KaiC/GvpD/RAD55 family RecA-like ATPase